MAWDEAVAVLVTAPGIGRRVAELIIADVATDIDRFPSEAHLASWAKVSPSNHESGGKRYSGKMPKGAAGCGAP
jgi:transposase